MQWQKNVKLCLVRIHKQNLNINYFSKNKNITLSSLEYSISLGEDPNWHMPCFHYYLPFIDFSNVMHFYKSPWAILIDTYLKPLQTLSSIVASLYVFEKCMTKISSLKTLFQTQHITTYKWL